MISWIISKRRNGELCDLQRERWESGTVWYRTAAIKQHHQILDLSTGEQDFPKFHVKYHASCRKGFVNQKSLEILTRKSTESIETGKDKSQLRWSSCDLQGSSGNSTVLQDTCVFCNKGKYKPGTRTREKLRRVEAFTTDEMVRKSACLHLKGNTNMRSIAAEISGICA